MAACVFRTRCPAAYDAAANAPAAVRRAARRAPCSRSVAANVLSQRSSNPAMQFGKLQEAFQENKQSQAWPGDMTMNGALGKTAILLAITCIGAAVAWQQCVMQLVGAQQAGTALVGAQTIQNIRGVAGASGIGAFVVAMATTFKPNWARWSAPLYAAIKGFFLGAVSFSIELSSPGIAMTAVLLTLGTAGGLLGLYKSRMITVGERMRNIIQTSIMGLLCAYLAKMVLGLCGVRFAFLQGGPVAIGISLLTTVLAASTFLLDFDNMERMERQGAPQSFEWYCGFSVLVSLAWLYMEMLRLLQLLSNRDN